MKIIDTRKIHIDSSTQGMFIEKTGGYLGKSSQELLLGEGKRGTVNKAEGFAQTFTL